MTPLKNPNGFHDRILRARIRVFLINARRDIACAMVIYAKLNEKPPPELSEMVEVLDKLLERGPQDD